MIVGIDLGTTNSLVAVWRNGESEVIPNSLNELLTPSVVGMDDEGRVIVGQAAKERLITHPDKTVANVKRFMGTNKVLNLGKKSFRPEEISALILQSLKADAESYLGEEVREAVITVPAYFNDSQRKATKAAGELAGLKVERLLNEPTAAALAYGLHNRNEGRYLVFDLGGGTFDISVVEYFEGILQVHASAGDNFLGGEDFSELIYKHFHDKIAQQLGQKNLDIQLTQHIRRKADQVKHALTKQREVVTQFSVEGNPLELSFTQEEFDSMAQPILKRLENPIRRALKDSKLKAADLDEVVMVGGATRTPLVRKLATQLFQRFPAIDIDPDKVVAVGSAIQAGLKVRDAALNDTVMTDVCPYSLGTDVVQGEGDQIQTGFFLPIIERNSFIPISREKVLHTAHDNQSAIEVNIYQGENAMVKDNVFLGSLTVKVPKRPRYEESISVRFTYDINGLLEVEVKVLSTQLKQSITIEKNPGLMTEAEIKERLKALAKLKIHPRDHLPNQTLISRAERIYQEALGDMRLYVSTVLADFMSVLDRQDDREIREARKEFESILDKIEDEPVF